MSDVEAYEELRERVRSNPTDTGLKAELSAMSARIFEARRAQRAADIADGKRTGGPVAINNGEA